MPRPYHLGRRQLSTDQTRTRIVEAARAILLDPEMTYTAFSIDAVARQADVARMTVYHQFGSKVGLLEGLCDALAIEGGMEQLAAAFRCSDLDEALELFITTFGRFWDADRLIIRRLNAFAVFDPDFGEVMRTRNERRRNGLRVLLERHLGAVPAADREADVDLLFAITSFPTFDVLAGPQASLAAAAPSIVLLARLLLQHRRA
jgi:AcrR family transcriptional regulator